MSDDYLWDPTAAPDPEIARIEALLRPLAHRPEPLRDMGTMELEAPRARSVRVVRWTAIAAGIVLATGALYSAGRGSVTPWRVTASAGAPVVRGAGGQPAAQTLVRGGVVETDAKSAAVLTVGRIGRAELGPGSTLRLIAADASEHRLALEHGTMHVDVDAPPRFFLVETPSALAVDLGCVYTLSVDERGSGLLTVDEGEVELQHGTVRASVLAGNVVAIHPGTGPGLPYPTRASAALRRAVAAYDASSSSATAIDAVLASADAHSTITLWHLLQRVEPAARGRVFDRLATLAPPPASVTRARALRGESGALQRWRTDLEPAWVIDPPRWRMVWNRLRR